MLWMGRSRLKKRQSVPQSRKLRLRIKYVKFRNVKKLNKPSSKRKFMKRRKRMKSKRNWKRKR